VLADPRAVAARWPEPRMRALAELAVTVTEAPWTLERARFARVLSEDDIVHAVALAAYFGHLNRIADAVGVDLDYQVARRPTPIEPHVPPYAPAPTTIERAPVLARTTTATALAAWTSYVMERDATITREQRAMIARRVGQLMGLAVAGTSPRSALDHDLLALADQITLAPWRLGPDSFTALRAAGFDDATLFDACVVASTAGVTARIGVALGRD
jgi:alkylhydroperoxidase family enzyme